MLNSIRDFYMLVASPINDMVISIAILHTWLQSMIRYATTHVTQSYHQKCDTNSASTFSPIPNTIWLSSLWAQGNILTKNRIQCQGRCRLPLPKIRTPISRPYTNSLYIARRVSTNSSKQRYHSMMILKPVSP